MSDAFSAIISTAALILPPTMSGITEIYICQQGQALKQGELVVSHDVTTREQAQADAAARCRIDRKIARIVYYAIQDDGGFRSLYSHDNTAARAPKSPRPLVADVKYGPAAKFRGRRPRPTFFGRFRALFEAD